MNAEEILTKKNDELEDARLNVEQKQDKVVIRDFLLAIEEDVIQYVNDRLKEVCASGSMELPVKMDTILEDSKFYDSLTGLFNSVDRQRAIYEIEAVMNNDAKEHMEIKSKKEPDFWWHTCKTEGKIGTEEGHECNWCGAIQTSEISG